MCDSYVNLDKVPQSGWREEDAYDATSVLGDPQERHPCHFGCGRDEEQFLHRLVHDGYDDSVAACYYCALQLTGGSETVQRSQLQLQRWNAAKRQWIHSEWPQSKLNNEHVILEDYVVGVNKADGWAYWIARRSEEKPLVVEERFSGVAQAKAALFHHLEFLKTFSDIETVEAIVDRL